MQIETIELSQIDFRALDVQKVVRARYGKQDHSRWIFSTRSEASANGSRLFYKVWNRNHIRRDNLLAALESGFYDSSTVPALRALIFSGGLCRGYVMEECFKSRKKDKSFFDLVAQRTAETRYFAVQFGQAHTMEWQGQPSMIDLEGVYPVADLHLVRAHFSAFASADYAMLVESLFREQSKEADFPVGDLPLEQHHSWLHQPFRKSLQTARKYQGKALSKLFPRHGLIER